MSKSNQNKKTEDNGLKIRPVFPQDKIDGHKAQTLGSTEEELLTELYNDHAKWLEEVKTVCERGGIALEQYLRKGLGLAIKDRRVRDCKYDTGLRLRGQGRYGQDVLLFFVKKCPHARDALLRGELPPYPWRTTQVTVTSGTVAQRQRRKKKGKKRGKSSVPTKRQEEAYTLVHGQGKTPQQAALEMDCSPQNVYKLLREAEIKVKAAQSRSVNFSKMQKLPTDRRGQETISDSD